MTLACKDGNSKLVEVTVVDVDDEDRVGNSLLQIWEILSTMSDQDCEFEVQVSRVMKWNLGRDSEARFGQYFEA